MRQRERGVGHQDVVDGLGHGAQAPATTPEPSASGTTRRQPAETRPSNFSAVMDAADWASTTATSSPPRARARPSVRPTMPPPETTASYFIANCTGPRLTAPHHINSRSPPRQARPDCDPKAPSDALALGTLIEAGKLDPPHAASRNARCRRGRPTRNDCSFAAERAIHEVDAAYARAKSGIRRSRLDGVPLAWKDNIDVVGAPCEAGSALLKGRMPEKDAVVVRRAGMAGLVGFAKTGMTEFAFSGLGLNPWSGTPPNVFDKKTPRLPGGSSAGSGVAVGMGLCALGIGTDTGGSVRIPAAWNNIVGLKTTAGLVPLDGTVPLSPTFDTVGPLARSVSDVAALHEVFANEPAIDLTPAFRPVLLAAAGGVLAGIQQRGPCRLRGGARASRPVRRCHRSACVGRRSKKRCRARHPSAPRLTHCGAAKSRRRREKSTTGWSSASSRARTSRRAPPSRSSRG